MTELEEIIKTQVDSFIVQVINESPLSEKDIIIKVLTNSELINNPLKKYLMSKNWNFFLNSEIRTELIRIKNYEIIITLLDRHRPESMIFTKQEIETIWKNTHSHYIRELSEAKLWLFV